MLKLGLALTSASFVGGALTLVDYCDQLALQCESVHSLSGADCQAAMNATDLGTLGQVDSNTIACRYKFLDDAAYNTTERCRYAGLTGGGRCGSVLNNTCEVAAHVCARVAAASYADAATCKTELGGLIAQWGSNQGSASAAENSLECRVYHATASLAAAPSHCSHWSQASVHCSGRVVPSTAHYCELLEYNCNTSNTIQFTNKAQCLNAAKTIPTNSTDSAVDIPYNSLGCRVYHAQAAKVLTADHCGHAGPSGGEVCGTTLEAWGSILAAAPCSDTSVRAYVASVAPAVINAAIPPGYRTASPTMASYTSVLDNGMNTQACRVYHLGVASAGGAAALAHCAHGDLSGAGNCGANLVDNLCQFIGASCTFGKNDSYQFADLASCRTALTNSTTNVIQVGMYTVADKNTYYCRFYHAAVAASYMSGGANAMMADATTTNRLHCSHVLKNAAAGGCGSGTTTTTAPTTIAPTVRPSTTNSTANSASTWSFAASLVAAVATSFSL